MSFDGDSRSLRDLARDVVSDAAHIVRQEARVARLETAAIVHGLGTGIIATALGAVLAVLGLVSLFTGLVLLPGDQWLRDREWLGAAIVALAVGIGAALLARRGRHLLSPSRLVPDESVHVLEENREWLKHRLTSDATSK